MANTESTRAFAQSQTARRSHHGEARTRLHRIWCKMKTRCTSNLPCYAPWYRDLGIRVYAEWAESYELFRDWALANGYADNLEIDRIDSNKGYNPNNCRWATRVQQMQNTRKNRDSVASHYKGVCWCKRRNRWRMQIKKDDLRVSRLFHTELEAAKAYDAAALKYFGEYAHLNFPGMQ